MEYVARVALNIFCGSLIVFYITLFFAALPLEADVNRPRQLAPGDPRPFFADGTSLVPPTQ